MVAFAVVFPGWHHHVVVCRRSRGEAKKAGVLLVLLVKLDLYELTEISMLTLLGHLPTISFGRLARWC